MNEKRRALGRGLGALIPSGPPTPDQARASRPTDVFFPRSGEDAPYAGGHGSSGGQADGSSDGSDERRTTEPAQESPDDSSEAGTTGKPRTSSVEGAFAEADGLAPVPGATFALLPIDAVRPNPRQPRTIFDEDDLAELAHSIAEIGVLQPVVVRRAEPGNDTEADQADQAESGESETGQASYELIMGERRLRAAQLAGLETIPAIVKDTHDDDLLRDALLENLHRSQLNPLEEAAAYQQLLEDFGCSHEELATRIGRSRPQISNTIRLLRLPPLVARRVAAGVLSAGHARALLSLDDGAAMERLAQRIVAEGLSVRSVEEIVAVGDLGGDDSGTTPRRRPRPGSRHPQLDEVAARLSDRLDTRVSIALGQRKGKLTVEFASVEDLDRIIGLLGVPDSDDEKRLSAT